jgi:hypothetical protein
MTATGGRMVLTPGEVQPYKVVLEHAQSNDTEHAFATMREGEAFIRSELPVTPAAAFDFGAGSLRKSPALPGAEQAPNLAPAGDER